MQAETTAAETEKTPAEQFIYDIRYGTEAVVTLSEDLTLTSAAIANRDIIIDLNGHNIIAATGQDGISVWSGRLTIRGQGSIISTMNALSIYGSRDESKTDYTNVVIEKDVTLKSGANSYGIGILANQGACYGVNVTFKGKIIGNYGISVNGLIGEKGFPVVNITDGAAILTADGGAAGSLPIYAAGKATWNIGKATLTGKGAVGIKSGTLNFTGTTITIDGAAKIPSISNNGIDTTGSVFQIEENTPPYAGGIVLNIDGGTYTSKQSSVFTKYGKEDTAQVKINVKGGTFKAADEAAVLDGDYAKENLAISGGTFSGSDLDALKTYLPTGYVISSTGTVTAPTSSGSSRPSGSTSEDTQTVLKNDTGEVSVEGNFELGKVFLSAKLSSKQISAFGNAKYALYDINLLNAAGEKVNPNGTVTVSIKVPAALNGEKSSIYHVSDDGMSVEKLASTYKDGVISFQVEHFSYYAIVEDGGIDAGAVNTPDTGVLGGRVAGAVSSILPMLAIAGGLFALYSRKLMNRRQAEIRADVETEVRADAAKIIAEAETTAAEERFVAAPMTAADEAEIKARIFGEK